MKHYDVIVVGAGPAGSTAAAIMASRGARTLLLEEKRMPREKVCGEFITPECFPTLQRLSVFQRVLEAGAESIRGITLSAPGRAPVRAAISDISGANYALGVTRSRFDHILFDRASESGAECLEGIAVKRCIYNSGSASPSGVECLALSTGRPVIFHGSVIVDASGRNSRLMFDRSERTAGRRGSRRYAMKAHLTGVGNVGDQVQLFFFRGGYGGLSPVENGVTNLCFITTERTLYEAGGDAGTVLKTSLFLDPLARDQLGPARLEGKWHSVGPLVFGRKRLHRAGVLAAGDSAGMIDPFTGTGIQIALRTGEMLAECVLQGLDGSLHGSSQRGKVNDTQLALANPVGAEPLIHHNTGLISSVAQRYQDLYDAEFKGRMVVASLLRRVAFSSPGRALAAELFSAVPWLTKQVLRATRAV